MNAPMHYRGKEKYIFISYSHKDTAKVYPIISKLSEEGYRVWYDSGIDPGTEWDENIAQHIEECGYFIAFISEHYLASNNCKDELNYVRDLEKERLIVYLENVTLPSGMAMRINRLQSIHKPAYANENDFYEKLFQAKGIEVCYGEKPAVEPKVSPVQATQPVELKVSPVQATRPVEPRVKHETSETISVAEMAKCVVKTSTSGTVVTNEKHKSKGLAMLLALFLGWLGVHDFYLGYYVKGIAKIVLTIATLSIVSFLWSLLDIILLFTGRISTGAKGVPIR